MTGQGSGRKSKAAQAAGRGPEAGKKSRLSNPPSGQSVVRVSLKQRGSALIEFVVSVALFWIPLFFGTTQFGLNLIQAIQVAQVCRDAGHLYAYGVSFSQSSNQYLLANLSPWLNIDPTGHGGTSVVLMSTVQYVTATECQAGGYTTTCPNNGMLVFTNQTVVGNPSLHASAFGTPATDAYGNVQAGSPSSSGYLNQASAVVQGFPNITLSSGSSGQQYAYISELYSGSTSLNWLWPKANWVTSIAYF